MKNLAKVVMSLAVVMLISVSAFAQTFDASDKTGSVTLEVQDYLVFALNNQELDFIYHAIDANNPAPQVTTFMVRSNINWTASVIAINNPFTELAEGESIVLNVKPVGGTYAPISMTTASTVDGIKTENKTFTYDFVFSGNPAPGNYVTNLNYTIAPR